MTKRKYWNDIPRTEKDKFLELWAQHEPPAPLTEFIAILDLTDSTATPEAIQEWYNPNGLLHRNILCAMESYAVLYWARSPEDTALKKTTFEGDNFYVDRRTP